MDNNKRKQEFIWAWFFISLVLFLSGLFTLNFTHNTGVETFVTISGISLILSFTVLCTKK